jgi:hypothetical protein
MKKRIAVLVVLLSLLGVFPVDAVVSSPDFLVETGYLDTNWFPWPPNTCEFEVRIGQGGCSGDWEFGHKFNGTYLDTSGQRVWQNGVDVYFRITHNKTAGTITMDLSGCCSGGTKIWVGNPGEGMQDFFILGKTYNSNWTAEVHELLLNGVPVDGQVIGQNTRSYMRIFGKPMDDATLEGYIRFTWLSGSPWHSDIEAMFSHSRPVVLVETGHYFADLQYLLDNPILQDGDHINGQLRELFYPWVEYDRPDITVTLGDTMIKGALSITGGTIIADNLIIK